MKASASVDSLATGTTTSDRAEVSPEDAAAFLATLTSLAAAFQSKANEADALNGALENPTSHDSASSLRSGADQAGFDGVNAPILRPTDALQTAAMQTAALQADPLQTDAMTPLLFEGAPNDGEYVAPALLLPSMTTAANESEVPSTPALRTADVGPDSSSAPSVPENTPVKVGAAPTTAAASEASDVKRAVGTPATAAQSEIAKAANTPAVAQLPPEVVTPSSLAPNQDTSPTATEPSTPRGAELLDAAAQGANRQSTRDGEQGQQRHPSQGDARSHQTSAPTHAPDAVELAAPPLEPSEGSIPEGGVPEGSATEIAAHVDSSLLETSAVETSVAPAPLSQEGSSATTASAPEVRSSASRLLEHLRASFPAAEVRISQGQAGETLVSMNHPDFGAVELNVQMTSSGVDIAARVDGAIAASLLRRSETSLRKTIHRQGLSLGRLRVERNEKNPSRRPERGIDLEA